MREIYSLDLCVSHSASIHKQNEHVNTVKKRVLHVMFIFDTRVGHDFRGMLI